VALCFCLPLHAAWQRVVQTEKGEGTEAVTAHPLRYFTADQAAREDGDGLCRECKSKVVAGAIESELHAVGKIAGFTIADVLYKSGSAVKWKSILVQAGDDQYVEIYHLQTALTNAVPTPSVIVTSGKQQLLATRVSDGANGGGCWEHYWAFDSDGAQSIDFAPVAAAISRRVSPATFVSTCSALHLEQQEVRAPVQKADAQCGACGWIGIAKARFRLHGAKVEALDVVFTPGNAKKQ
jgi:hypothetical protein